MGLFRVLSLFDKWLFKVEGIFLVIVLSLMFLMAGVQVVLKLLHKGLEWLEMFTRYLVVWVGFLGASMASHQVRHINIDVISRSLGERGKMVLSIIVHLFAFAITVFLIVLSSRYVLDKKNMADTMGQGLAFQIPLGEKPFMVWEWWLALIMPIGFVLMSIHFLLRVMEALSKLLFSKRLEEKEGG